MALNATLSRSSKFYATFPRVSIVGLGEEGNSVVNSIFEGGSAAAQCIAVNADEGHLEHVHAHEKILIGPDITGDNTRAEQRPARECASLVMPLLTSADVTFIVAKMGEENEASTASAIADIARRIGAVTVGFAIMPSPFERDSGFLARQELIRMRKSCHTLAIVDTSRSTGLLAYPSDLSADFSDGLVVDVVSGLSETLACPSAVNIDFAAFRELMIHGGIAHIGIARSSSALRVEEATMGALRGPLLYDSIARTRGALVNVRGDSSLTNEEAERATQLLAERVRWNLPIVMGASVDGSWYEGCQVSILLTGAVYPYIPGGYRRLPLDMYEMEPDAEEDEAIDLELDLDQLEES